MRKSSATTDSGPFDLAVSENDVFELLAAVAGNLEEDIFGHSASSLATLCALHGRLSAFVGFKPDYFFKNGLVHYASTGGVLRPAQLLDRAGCDD